MLFSLKTAMSLPSEPKTLMTKCPFCKADVMFVDGEKFTCFNCYETGNVVDFLVKRDGISHKRAEWQAERSKPSEKAISEILNCNKLAAEFFHSQLNPSNYFSKRGIKNETIDSFKLGYAPSDSNELLTYLKDRGVSEAAMLATGLFYIDNTFKSFFRRRAIFPIFDEKGNVVGFGGRRIYDDDDTPKYLNTSENLVFHKRDLLYGINKAKGNDTLYFVEGYMDVISLHQNGITNAVAALGTAVGDHHCSLLKEIGVKKIILALDSDEAGTKSALKSIPILRKYFDVSVVRFDGAKDPDEYMQKYGKEAFLSLKETKGETFIVNNCKNSEACSFAVDFLL